MTMTSRMTTTAFKARKMNLLDRIKEMDKNKTMLISRRWTGCRRS
jgi:hypothetical protein